MDSEEAPDANRPTVETERLRADRYQYLATMMQLPALSEQGQFDRIRSLLQRTPHEANDFVWNYWNRLCHSDGLILRDYDRRINAVDFSPDGTRVVLGYESTTTAVWNLVERRVDCALTERQDIPLEQRLTGYQVLRPDEVEQDEEPRMYHLIKYHSAVHGVGFLPDGKRAWTVTYGGNLSLWDAGTGQHLRTLFDEQGRYPHSSGDVAEKPPHFPNCIGAAVRSPDRQRVVLGGDGPDAWIVDLETGRILHTLPSNSGSITAVAWSPDGAWVAAACRDDRGMAWKIWDAVTGRELYSGPCYNRVHSLAVDARSGTLVTAVEGQVDFWDVATGTRRRGGSLSGYATGHVSFSPDGSYLAVSDWKTTRLWDMSRSAWTDFQVPSTGVIAFSPDGDQVIAGERVQPFFRSPQETFRLRSVPKGKIVDEPIDPLHLDVMSCEGFAPMAISPEGQYLVIAAYGQTEHQVPVGMRRYTRNEQQVWGYAYDLVNGRIACSIAEHKAAIMAIAFGAKGDRFVSGSRDGKVVLRETATGRPLRILEITPELVSAVALSSDGAWIAAGSASAVHVWNSQTGELRHTLEFDIASIYGVAFSPDGSLLAAGGRDHILRLWDAATGESLGTARARHNIGFVAFSPDGHSVLAGSEWGNYSHVWDVPTLREQATLVGSGTTIVTNWGQDSNQVVTGNRDGTVCLWDTRTEGIVLTLRGHTSPIALAAFLDRGRTLLTASQDGVLRWWHP